MDGIRIEQKADREHIEELEEENEKLKEKVETLELWLDNKEKVNKNLREELEKLKKIRDGKDDYIRDLEEKNYELETEIVRLHKEAEYY